MPFSRPPFTGFPFDREDRDRDRGFRTQLEDLAVRHPEFAEHLLQAGSPRRDPFAQERRGFTERPFRSRFEQFGFPFTDEFDEEEVPAGFFRRGGSQDSGERKGANENQTEQKVDDKPPRPPQQPTQHQNEDASSKKTEPKIQQSSTVDLGQPQEPVDDGRSQRSMSAPPENRTGSGGKRFVSSINIPNLNVPPQSQQQQQQPHQQSGGAGDMGGRMSSQEPQQTPPQQQQQSQNKPTERIIPIHIEGRDEPVIPKNVNTSSARPEQDFGAGHRAEPDRIFGQRPGTFTQFLSREDEDRKREDERRRQQEEYQRQQDEYMKQQQEYQRQQQQQYQQQQQRQYQQAQQEYQQAQQEYEQAQQQQQATPPPPPQPPKPTPLDMIKNIQTDVSKLMEDVEKFTGKPKDKQYLYLDEMLTRNLLKLDNIETEGKDTIRQARKEAIKCIEQCIQVLENMANQNEKAAQAAEPAQSAEKMETDVPSVNTEAATETEVKPEEAESDNKVPETPAETKPAEEPVVEATASAEEKTEETPETVDNKNDETTTTDKKKTKKKK